MKKFINYILWPVLAGAVFAMTVQQLPPVVERFFPANATPTDNELNETRIRPTSFNTAIEKVMPAVVTINLQQVLAESGSSTDQTNSLSSISTQQFTQLDENNSLGSGVIITSDGFLVTSYHIFISPETGVVNFFETITATLSDGRVVNARPLVYDEASDLALLKIDTPNVAFVEPYDNPDQKVGDVAIAIGNPRNLGLSASIGIISGIRNTEESFLLQTDAAINPGFSGGALIDSQGNLIGINSNILSESGGSEGLGFATHAAMISLLLDYYYASGPGGYLGVSNASFFSRNQGILLYGQNIEGAKVLSLVQDGPAHKAGIQLGDIITGFNQKKFGILQNEDDLFNAIASISSLGAGEVVDIEVFREDKFINIPVTLGVGEPFVLFSIQ